MKRVFKYLFLLLLIFPFCVKADEIDLNKLGSFNINYLYGDKKLEGEIKLYKVANVNINREFTFLSDYTLEDSLEPDSASEWNNLALKISNYINSNNIDKLDSCKTNNGVCKFSNLGVGLYLVTSEEVTSDNYIYKASPSLLSIPNYNEFDKVYIYDEDVTLKTEAKAITIDTSDNNTTGGVPKTLDMFDTYLIVFVISIVAVVFIVLYINYLRRKEKRNEKDK